MRAEVERQEKRRLDETRASALSEEARRLASERRSRAEARHRRAEETREARVAEIVAKASEETRKVEEIAFYNSLETENKKAALRERLCPASPSRDVRSCETVEQVLQQPVFVTRAVTGTDSHGHC